MKFPILSRKSHSNKHTSHGKSAKNDDHKRRHSAEEEHIITMPDHSSISMTDGSHISTSNQHHHHRHHQDENGRHRRRSNFDDLSPQDKIHLLEECANMGATGTASYLFKMMKSTPVPAPPLDHEPGELDAHGTSHSHDKPATPRAA